MTTESITTTPESMFLYKTQLAELPEGELPSEKMIDGLIHNFLVGLEDVPEHQQSSENLVFDIETVVCPGEIVNFFEVIIPSRIKIFALAFKTQKQKDLYRKKIDGPSMENQINLFKKIKN